MEFRPGERKGWSKLRSKWKGSYPAQGIMELCRNPRIEGGILKLLCVPPDLNTIYVWGKLLAPRV